MIYGSGCLSVHTRPCADWTDVTLIMPLGQSKTMWQCKWLDLVGNASGAIWWPNYIFVALFSYGHMAINGQIFLVHTAFKSEFRTVLRFLVPLTASPPIWFHPAHPKTCADRWWRGPWRWWREMSDDHDDDNSGDEDNYWSKFCLEQLISVDSLRTAAISDGFHRNASPLVAL